MPLAQLEIRFLQFKARMMASSGREYRRATLQTQIALSRLGEVRTLTIDEQYFLRSLIRRLSIQPKLSAEPVT